MRVWGVALACAATLGMTVGSAAQPAPKPSEVAYYLAAPGAKLCAAVYAFRHREDRTSLRGTTAQAAAKRVVAELVKLTGEEIGQISNDTIARADAIRAGLLGQDAGITMGAKDVQFVIGMCDKAYGQKVGEVWTPRPDASVGWKPDAQLVCATFYQRSISKAQLQAGRNEASRAADNEIKTLARQLDRTYPETFAIVRQNVADFETALKEGRITEGKILETIDMCDNHYSYYVADNYAPAGPFDCTGAAVAGLNGGNEALAKATRLMDGKDYDIDIHAYYIAMSCGHFQTALRKLESNSCPAELVSKVRGQYDSMVVELDKLNDGSHEYYSCSLTP